MRDLVLLTLEKFSVQTTVLIADVGLAEDCHHHPPRQIRSAVLKRTYHFPDMDVELSFCAPCERRTICKQFAAFALTLDRNVGYRRDPGKLTDALCWQFYDTYAS
jgi:hypothetical protein